MLIKPDCIWVCEPSSTLVFGPALALMQCPFTAAERRTFSWDAIAERGHSQQCLRSSIVHSCSKCYLCRCSSAVSSKGRACVCVWEVIISFLPTSYCEVNRNQWYCWPFWWQCVAMTQNDADNTYSDPGSSEEQTFVCMCQPFQNGRKEWCLLSSAYRLTFTGKHLRNARNNLQVEVRKRFFL